MAGHGEDEIVSASMLGLATHLLFQDFYDRFIGDFFVGFGVGIVIQTTLPIVIQTTLPIVIQTTGGRKNLNTASRCIRGCIQILRFTLFRSE